MAYEFKVGDRGLCSDGVTEYEVVRKLKKGELTVVKTDINGADRVTICNKNGHGFDDPIYHLTPPKKQADFWVNVYSDSSMGGVYFSKEEADCGCYRTDRIACLRIVRDYEEGEGL